MCIYAHICMHVHFLEPINRWGTDGTEKMKLSYMLRMWKAIPWAEAGSKPKPVFHQCLGSGLTSSFGLTHALGTGTNYFSSIRTPILHSSFPLVQWPHPPLQAEQQAVRLSSHNTLIKACCRIYWASSGWWLCLSATPTCSWWRVSARAEAKLPSSLGLSRPITTWNFWAPDPPL